MRRVQTPPGLLLGTAGSKGLGVFAQKAFQRGDLLLTFEGPVLDLASVRDFTHVIQVGAETFRGASGGVDDFVNHACVPNAGLRNVGETLELFALRTIHPWDELTFDYSTCMVAEAAFGPCACRTARCRGMVTPFRDLPPRVQAHYAALGAAPEFARESVEQEATSEV